MNWTKKRVAIAGAIAVLLAGFSATSTPAASGQSEGGAVTVRAAELSGPVVPVAGWDSEAPRREAAYPGSPVTPSGAEAVDLPGYAESVIGLDGRSRVQNTTGTTDNNPSFAIGQIELVSQGQSFICTGWLIDRNSIVTAGHCAFDPDAPSGEEIIEAATWFPGRDGAVDPGPSGGCPVVEAWAPPTEWVINGQAYFDFAVMNFSPSGICADIGAVTGTFGLYANATRDALNGVAVTIQGYPGDKPYGTHWKMAGRITRANKRYTFYPMDTAGGQSGSPVWRNRRAGACVGNCGYAVHAYGTCTDPSCVGLVRTNNGGPRLTAFRLGQIRDVADNNGV